MCSTRLFFFPGFEKAGLLLPQDRDEYKYTRAVIAGHAERKRRGNGRVFVFVTEAGGAAAGRRAPAWQRSSRVHSQAVRLPGNPSAAAWRAAPRHTQSFLARGPSRLRHGGLVCGFNVCFINRLPEKGDQGGKKTNGARVHANFKLISRKIKAVSPFN